MGRMQRILDSYRADILPKNPRNFALMAESPLDEIHKLQVSPAMHNAMGSYLHIKHSVAEMFNV
jgi:hypothetical protein